MRCLSSGSNDWHLTPILPGAKPGSKVVSRYKIGFPGTLICLKAWCACFVEDLGVPVFIEDAVLMVYYYCPSSQL